MLHVFGLFTLGFLATWDPVCLTDWPPARRKWGRRVLIVLVTACTVALNPAHAATSPTWGALFLAYIWRKGDA